MECVLLTSDGGSSELVVDMTPKKREVQGILAGDVSFLGQWYKTEEVEGVVLVVNKGLQETGFKQENEGKKLKKGEVKIQRNTHVLQPPFNKMIVFGDIFLMRTTEDGTPVPFTKKEYVKYAKRTDIEEFEVDDDESDDGMGFSGSEDDDSDMESLGESDSDDDMGEEEAMFEMIMGAVQRKFADENGREPTEDELNALSSAIMEKMGGGEEGEEEEDMSGEELDDIEEGDDDVEEVEEEVPVPVKASKKKAPAAKKAAPAKKETKKAAPAKKETKRAVPAAKKQPAAKNTKKGKK